MLARVAEQATHVIASSSRFKELRKEQ